jgi:hypothetical protein
MILVVDSVMLAIVGGRASAEGDFKSGAVFAPAEALICATERGFVFAHNP